MSACVFLLQAATEESATVQELQPTAPGGAADASGNDRHRNGICVTDMCYIKLHSAPRQSIS